MTGAMRRLNISVESFDTPYMGRYTICVSIAYRSQTVDK